MRIRKRFDSKILYHIIHTERMATKVLIVLTSAKASPWGKDTGYWLEELAAPYNTFVDAGYDVEIASITGGVPPVDANSTAEGSLTEDTKRFSDDAIAAAKLNSTKPIAEYTAKTSEYSAIFLPGGHGTALDFEPSVALKQVIEGIYSHGGVVAAVCHGPCGLVTAINTTTGEPLVKGKKVTGFSDEEETVVGLAAAVPFSLESRLKELGGIYERTSAWAPHVVVDGNLVTGQNPGSSKLVGQQIVTLLHSS
jgi:putative intracellular protease/amidase